MSVDVWGLCGRSCIRRLQLSTLCPSSTLRLCFHRLTTKILFSHTVLESLATLVPTAVKKATKEASSAPPVDSAEAIAAAGDADGDDPMGMTDRPTAGGGGGSGGATGSGSALSAGGGLKRPLDPLDDENDTLETVRIIRRRLVLGGGEDNEDGDGGTDGARGGGGGGDGGTTAKAGEGARVQISNADLAELMRSTKPKGDPRRWAKVLFRAQNSRQGAHAGGERRAAAGLRG